MRYTELEVTVGSGVKGDTWPWGSTVVAAPAPPIVTVKFDEAELSAICGRGCPGVGGVFSPTAAT